MKVKLLILAALVAAGAFAAHKVNQFRNSPTGKVIEQIQEKKQLIEDIQKSPITHPPLNK